MPAVVAIIGRPNVGKSTLFNRILGERKAIESDVAGTTRDTVTAFYEGENCDFLLVDTGGLDFESANGKIEEDTQTQARIAAKEADAIVFCLNTKEEFTRDDLRVAEFLRANAGKTPVFLVGTKADSGGSVENFPEFFSLGIGEDSISFVSATHNKGVFALLSKVEENLAKRGFQKRFKREEDDVSPPKIAFFGRPNAGKSSFVNALLGREECIVSEIAGTTRDTKDTEILFDKKKYILVDTAGIRKRSNISDPIEKYAVLRTFQAISECDVIVYLVDSKETISAQDQKLLGELKDLNTGVMIAVNKWDLQEKGEEAQKRYMNYLRRKIPFLPWAPVVFTSALNKRNVLKIFPSVDEIVAYRSKRCGTGQLNSFLKEVQTLHPPAGLKNMHPKMKYITQVSVNPPHFVVFGSKLDFLHFSYIRYFEHRIRDAFGYEGTGIIVEYKNGGENPYDDSGGKKNWRAIRKGQFGADPTEKKEAFKKRKMGTPKKEEFEKTLHRKKRKK